MVHIQLNLLYDCYIFLRPKLFVHTCPDVRTQKNHTSGSKNHGSRTHSCGSLRFTRPININSVPKLLDKCQGLEMVTVELYVMFPCTPWKVDGKSLRWDKMNDNTVLGRIQQIHVEIPFKKTQHSKDNLKKWEGERNTLGFKSLLCQVSLPYNKVYSHFYTWL